MIGIVIVSHSATLAQGVHELVDQMVQGQVPIAMAGGSDNPDNPIGTDPMQVVTAIESVYNDDGVVVLMDMGSALMSAEAAVEFLLPEQQANIYLCEAPLVEGAMAAAVQAMGTNDVQQVLAEARGALAAKTKLLLPVLSLPEQEIAPSTPQPEQTGQAQVLIITIPNRLGLHARPAAKLVSLINRFQAQATIDYEGRQVNGSSINQVTTLGARQGDMLTISAQGVDRATLMAEIQELVDDNFGDVDIDTSVAEDKPQETALLSKNAISAGTPASSGIAIGPALHAQLPTFSEIQFEIADKPDVEWVNFQQAIQAALAELQTIHMQTAQRLDDDEAAIFQAHMLILQDPELQQAVQQQIEQEECSAAAAWQQVIQQTAHTYSTLDNAYLQERAQDVLDLGQRVLGHLVGATHDNFQFQEPSILIATELLPSDVAALDPKLALGIVTEQGGATGHSAILARALGIPTIVGVVDAICRFPSGKLIALDGGTGAVWADPDEVTLADLRQCQLDARQQQADNLQTAQQDAYTLDGKRIEVGANIGDDDEVAGALAYGAEGVGLFRTELLFMDRDQLPDEETQYQVYRKAASQLSPRPLIIRTLDVGGDKPIPYLPREHEENPFLGWRGIRYCLDNPQIFLPQLRALLRASAEKNVKIMLPMVDTLDELHNVKAFLYTAQNELEQAGIPFDPAIELGIMIETPAAVMQATELAQAVDFFSIGTNDLTQYMMAADRGNPRVHSLVNAFQPAVLRTIHSTVQAAHAAGIWVGICGELAGNPLAVPLLIGLGLNELSMSAPAIPQAKAIIRRWSSTETKALAEAVLALESSVDVEALLKEAVTI